MNQLGRVSRGKLLLDKIIQKRSEAELLERDFCVVAEIPNFLANKEQVSSPSYKVRTLNVTIQFISVENRSNCPFLKDNLVLLGGDPTGAVEVVFTPKSLKRLKIGISGLLCGVFSLLGVGLAVIQSRIYLVVLEDTRFLKCVSRLDSLKGASLSGTFSKCGVSPVSGDSEQDLACSLPDSDLSDSQSSNLNFGQFKFIGSSNNITQSLKACLV